MILHFERKIIVPLTKRKTYELLSVQIVVLTWNRQWGT